MKSKNYLHRVFPDQNVRVRETARTPLSNVARLNGGIGYLPVRAVKAKQSTASSNTPGKHTNQPCHSRSELAKSESIGNAHTHEVSGEGLGSRAPCIQRDYNQLCTNRESDHHERSELVQPAITQPFRVKVSELIAEAQAHFWRRIKRATGEGISSFFLDIMLIDWCQSKLREQQA